MTKRMNLFRLSYTLRPAPDGDDDRGVVVVGEDHSAGVLGDLCAGPHGDADVGGLDRWGVVHAVTGHGDDIAFLPQSLHEQHLVLGCDASDHADVVDAGQALLVTEGGEVGSEHRYAGDAELCSDGRSGDHVVAGHHPHSNPGVLGVVDGLHGRVAGRIDHRDDGRHLEIGDVAEQVAVGVERGGVEIADRCGHDPIPLTLHAGDGAVGLLLQGVVPRHDGAGHAGGGRPVEHGGRGTLHEATHHGLAGRRRWRC